MSISVDYQPRPIVANPSRHASNTEGVLDLDFNGRADVVTLSGKERLTEPVVDLLGLQALAKASGKHLFTETDLKEAGFAPKMVEHRETDSGVETCYSDVCLADTQGGQAMLKAAVAEEAQIGLQEQGYQIAGAMEFVVDPFGGKVFLSRKVTPLA